MDDLLQLLPTKAPKLQLPEEVRKAIAITEITDAEWIIAGTISTTVLTAPTFPWELFADAQILFRSSTIKRDRDRLLEYDFKISQAILDAGMNGNHLDQVVKVEEREKIDKALEPLWYMSLKKRWEDYNIEWKTYRKYATMLRSMNSIMKRQMQHKYWRQYFENIGTGYERMYNTPLDIVSKEVDNENLQIVWKKIDAMNQNLFVRAFWLAQIDITTAVDYIDIDMSKQIQYVRALSLAYQCADGKKNQCDTEHINRKDIQDMSKDLYKNTLLWDIKTSKNTILLATQRLLWAFGSNDKDNKKAYQQRKQQLIWSKYGASWDRKDGINDIYQDNAEFIRGNGVIITQVWDRLWQWRRKTMDAIKHNKKTVDETPWSEAIATEKWEGRTDEKNADEPAEQEALLKDVAKEIDSKPVINDTTFTSWYEWIASARQRSQLEQWIKSVFDTAVRWADKSSTHIALLETTPNKKVVEAAQWRRVSNQLIWNPDLEKSASSYMNLVCNERCPNLSWKECGDW